MGEPEGITKTGKPVFSVLKNKWEKNQPEIRVLVLHSCVDSLGVLACWQVVAAGIDCTVIRKC